MLNRSQDFQVVCVYLCVCVCVPSEQQQLWHHEQLKAALSQSALLEQTADHSLPPLPWTQAELMDVWKQSS